MQEHDESLAATRSEAAAAPTAAESASSKRKETSAAVLDLDASAPTSHAISPSQDALPSAHTSAPVPPAAAPPAQAIARPISPTAQLLLTSPSWPLLKLVHYYLACLFTLLPGLDHLRPHLPAEPDDVVYLDAAMHAFLLVIGILLVGKIYRNWDRWLILLVGRAGAITQRLFGFGLGVEPDVARAAAARGGRVAAAARPTLRGQGRGGAARVPNGAEPAAQPLNPPQAAAAAEGASPMDLHLTRARDRAEQL